MSDAIKVSVTLEWRFRPEVQKDGLYMGEELVGEVWQEREYWRCTFIPRAAFWHYMSAPTKAEARTAVEAAAIEALGGVRDE